MKKRGFTLIELLAVIVVLAIIALIATPIVMNTIKNSKKGAAERTADNYVEQVETSLMTYRMNNNESLPDGEYTIDSNGNLTGNGKTLTIEMNGTKPSSGTIVIENGQVKKESVSLKIDKYIVDYKETKLEAWLPYEGIICTAVPELSVQKYYDSTTKSMIEETVGLLASEAGPYALGVEYTCDVGDGEAKTFYVLEDGDTTELIEGRIAKIGEVSLIMNMNIDRNGFATTSYRVNDEVGQENVIEWCSKEDYLEVGGTEEEWGEIGNNNLGPITANSKLKEWTKSWKNLNYKQIKLPTYNQLLRLYTKKKKYYAVNLSENGGISGYWTSTKVENYQHAAWRVYSNSLSGGYNVNGGSIHGLRPVITISKSNLSY